MTISSGRMESNPVKLVKPMLLVKMVWLPAGQWKEVREFRDCLQILQALKAGEVSKQFSCSWGSSHPMKHPQADVSLKGDNNQKHQQSLNENEQAPDVALASWDN